MSKFTDMADTSHRLSLAAMEEASRYGQRTADIDHMLLALTVNEQIAGQVLRRLGITLAAARAALEELRSAQLASLGVSAGATEPGPIVFHETGGYEWSERSLTVIKRAGERKKRGDAAAVLRELVAEPSGLIEELLGRLGASREAVLAGLDEAERIPNHSSRRTSGAALSGSSEVFVPASAQEVWELLADPARIPEWDQMLGSVEAVAVNGAPELRPGDRWNGRARTERPDGKPLRIKPELRRQIVELRAIEPRSSIEWCMSYPDARAANARSVGIELEPAAGGTRLAIVFAWERRSDRRPRRMLRFLMRPLARFAIWMQLSQIGAGISRVFR